MGENVKPIFNEAIAPRIMDDLTKIDIKKNAILAATTYVFWNLFNIFSIIGKLLK